MMADTTTLPTETVLAVLKILQDCMVGTYVDIDDIVELADEIQNAIGTNHG